MPISDVSTNLSPTSSGSTLASQAGFRNADFLKIMLGEIVNQDPLEPQETGKLVDNMRKIQELENSTYTNFRNDIRWAQDLMGKPISVQQFSGTDAQAKALADKGVVLDRGFVTMQGKVDSFKVVDNQVYVTLAGKDYPITNVKQIQPQAANPDHLAEMAAILLGTKVNYSESDNTTGSGIVQQVAMDSHGAIQLKIGDQTVPYTSVTSIGLAGANGV